MAGMNGSAAAAQEYFFYDKRNGMLRWTQNGELYVNF